MAYLFAAMSCFPLSLNAGGGAHNLAIVVNEDSAHSKWIANEYIKLRNIPPSNVIYIKGLDKQPKIDITAFRQKILEPVLFSLSQRKLRSQITYLIYSCDFPTTVVASNLDTKKFRQTQNRGTSITGMTYLYQSILMETLFFINPGSNLYYRHPLPLIRDTKWTREEVKQLQTVMAFFAKKKNRQIAHEKNGTEETLQDKEWEKQGWILAEKTLTELAAAHPNNSNVQYNLACALSINNKPAQAVITLEKAYDAGFWNLNHIRKDPDLATIRNRGDYKALLSRLKKPEFETDSLGIKGAFRFNRLGQIVEQRERGMRYLMSTMLSVISSRGLTIEQSISYLRRSVEADGTKPDGTFYFMLNNNVRSKLRESAVPSVVKVLNKEGHKAVSERGTLPQNKTDVIGACIGAKRFDWSKCGSKILPGAICEHLTSHGGNLYGSSQTELSEFIRNGAAGASGTVSEPLSMPFKFPTPLLYVHYARGCSLAESFYQSVASPYHLLILGDPLCQPYATFPEVFLKPFPAKQIKGNLAISPKVTNGIDVSHFEVLVDGVRIETLESGDSWHLNTTTIPDGYHELRVVAVSADSIHAQGHIARMINVNNTGKLIKSQTTKERKIPVTGTIKIRTTCPGADRIMFSHNHRNLVVKKGATVEADIDAALLGPGPASIIPIGVFSKGGRIEVKGKALAFDILP